MATTKRQAKATKATTKATGRAKAAEQSKRDRDRAERVQGNALFIWKAAAGRTPVVAALRAFAPKVTSADQRQIVADGGRVTDRSIAAIAVKALADEPHVSAMMKECPDVARMVEALQDVTASGDRMPADGDGDGDYVHLAANDLLRVYRTAGVAAAQRIARYVG